MGASCLPFKWGKLLTATPTALGFESQKSKPLLRNNKKTTF